MDQDIASGEERIGMPPAARLPIEAPPLSTDPTIIDPAEHNIVFTSLVTGDQDVVGLVAYSIYKQNKYDWLMAFSRDQSRMPNDAEVHSYLLGESTTRRLATYRHLAEATLDGRGIDVPGDGASSGSRTYGPAGRADGERGSAAERGLAAERATNGMPLNRIVLIGIIAVILAVLGLIYLLHGGAAPK